MVQPRPCALCGLLKPPDAFGVNRAESDGVHRWCKECVCAKARAWREQFPEKAAQAKARYRADPANRAVERQTARRYEEAHPERRERRHDPGQQRAYREANADKERARKQAWNAANPDRVRDYVNQRRARLNGVAVSAVSLEVIFERDGGRCGPCGEIVPVDVRWPHPLSASLDHRKPLSKGGAHEYGNCWLAHLRCNQSKGTKETK